jgi:succinate dehydrogenase/fumarate reductase flavoprotein subunit
MSPGPGLNVSGTPVFFDKYKMPKATRSHWFNGTQKEAFREGWPSPGGTGLFKTVDDNIKKRNIKTLMQTGLTELIVNANREVLGVKALSGGKTVLIKAKRGVVMGTGHWLSNANMVRNYLRQDINDPNFFGGFGGFFTNKLSAPSQGDGIIAAEALGADLSFMAAGYNGGLKINPKAQVLDVYGKPIPRLYAGGRATGGIVNAQYPQCGIYLSSAIFFGRAAGRNAAAEKG